jgi:hypothetical protein
MPIKNIIQFALLTSMTVCGFANFYFGIFSRFSILLGEPAAIVSSVLALLSTGVLFVSIWRN